MTVIIIIMLVLYSVITYLIIPQTMFLFKILYLENVT